VPRYPRRGGCGVATVQRPTADSQVLLLESALVAVLVVVPTGKGIVALQAGWLHASSLSLPTVDFLGIYPSLQGIGARLLMAALVVAGFVWNAPTARARATRVSQE